MARFLPGLLSCRGWRMQALLKPAGWFRRVMFELDSNCKLTTNVPAPEEFDSEVERAFARNWGDEPREGWRLERETEILHIRQKVFVPDFVFQHEDGRRAMMEVIGFWTPEYLQQKEETLRQFHKHRILLAVVQSAKDRFDTDNPMVFSYKTVIKIDEVLRRLAHTTIAQ
jgi:predicted nuclease of restriction endonuclease-like RecB superfamily